MDKTAIITGITGQDGSYLSEFLLDKGYEVVGLIRRASINTTERVKHLLPNNKFKVVEGDLLDAGTLHRLCATYKPDEFYNLAAQSHVHTSFEQPSLTFNVTAGGVLNVLEAVRNTSPATRVYQASSSEMFGNSHEDGWQRETTPMHPVSPYGCAKLAGHNLIEVYRRSYNIWACSGILFNHESPKRGVNFVTRKITDYFGRYINNPKRFKMPKLQLGNLYACRDWCHARDMVRGMWMMLQRDAEPEDFVLARGQTYSILEFIDNVEEAIREVTGENINCLSLVESADKFKRPYELDVLQGDATKAREILGWEPQISFKGLVLDMVRSDIQAHKQ